MTTRELITKLLDFPMDEEIELYYPKEHEDEYGKCNGYLFHIDRVSYVDGGIVFTDWRDRE